jgi:tyrosine aminotransferase
MLTKALVRAAGVKVIKCSDRSNVPHPIRLFVDKEVVFPKNHKLPYISLALGEPVKASGFCMPPKSKQAVINAIQCEDFNGYGPSFGTPTARAAIAAKFGTSEFPLTGNDIFLTVGSYLSLYLTFMTLCERGDNILEPEPGFPMTSNAHNLGYKTKYYRLREDKDWEVDLKDMESKISKKTKAILLNNPSNPCGSVWSKAHMKEILNIAMKYEIPLVADEAYHSLVFGDRDFHSFGHLTKKHPIICTGSMSKMYCIPGWRLGWGLIYDYEGRLAEYRKNIMCATSLTLHPSTMYVCMHLKNFSG